MSASIEILKDFVGESKDIIKKALDLLEKVEGQMAQSDRLQEYGNLVDRIMGGAQSVGATFPPDHALHLVSAYTALCKAVGYKASQIKDNDKFYDVCVALLQDATETLDVLLDNLDKGPNDLRKLISNTFIERLRWVSNKFSSDYFDSVSGSKTGKHTMKQNEIDVLLKKLGV